MSDGDLLALAAKADGPRWQECHVHYALRSLPHPTAMLVRDVLANPHVSHRQVSDALAARSIEVARLTVGRHRAGDCKCSTCGCGTCASLVPA
jgi:hypothetical protein